MGSFLGVLAALTRRTSEVEDKGGITWQNTLQVGHQLWFIKWDFCCLLYLLLACCFCYCHCRCHCSITLYYIILYCIPLVVTFSLPLSVSFSDTSWFRFVALAKASSPKSVDQQPTVAVIAIDQANFEHHYQYRRGYLSCHTHFSLYSI